MVLKNLILGDTETFGGFLGLRTPSFREPSASHFTVPRVAVGRRNEFHQMTFGGELGGHASGFDVGIVRVRAEGDHANFGFLRHCHAGHQRQHGG